jgi:MAF protein
LTQPIHLILASGSPRRRELLGLVGWQFRVEPADVDETPFPVESPAAYVHRLAESKAIAASAQAGPDDIILAADTTVAEIPEGMAEEDGIILGKPADEAEAVDMLRRLRGRIHKVYTGLAVFRMSDRLLLTDLCSTDVKMRNYGDQEIAAYVASGDPFDKAGGYAIQNEPFHPVESIEGCYANVVGLPVCHVARLLSQVNLPPETDLIDQCLIDLHHPCPISAQILKG